MMPATTCKKSVEVDQRFVETHGGEGKLCDTQAHGQDSGDDGHLDDWM